MFRAALAEGRFFEGNSQTVHFEESHPAAFSHLVEWIYQQKVGVEEQGDLIKAKVMKEMYKKDVRAVMEQLTERAIMYIEVWKLADYLSMPKLANYIMRRLVIEFDPRKMKHEKGFNFLLLVEARYSTPAGSHMRAWIIRLLASGLAEFMSDGMFSYQSPRLWC